MLLRRCVVPTAQNRRWGALSPKMLSLQDKCNYQIVESSNHELTSPAARLVKFGVETNAKKVIKSVSIPLPRLGQQVCRKKSGGKNFRAVGTTQISRTQFALHEDPFSTMEITTNMSSNQKRLELLVLPPNGAIASWGGASLSNCPQRGKIQVGNYQIAQSMSYKLPNHQINITPL
jgi:hypothetical protein